VLGAVALFAVIVTAACLDAFRLLSRVDRVDLEMTGSGMDGTNYLLVGSDSRSFVRTRQDLEQFGAPNEVTGERADLIMVLHLPEGGGTPSLVAIPRDLLVTVSGEGDRRLALTYEAGPQGLVDALCSSLGLGIDHFLGLGFDGFRRLVDEVGGIDITVPYAIRDRMSGLNLETAGEHHLDGTAALALVRSRSAEEYIEGAWTSVVDGATSRQRNGELVLRALGARVGTRSGPLDWRKLLDASGAALTVDSGFGIADARQLQSGLRALDKDQVVGVQLPSTTLDGPVPVARLAPDAVQVLASVGAGTSEKCPGG
jgi:LCP family protein required for cell wall assembly